jgi:hypothetical protein
MVEARYGDKIMKSKLNKVPSTQILASIVHSARERGDYMAAERVQRKLVDFAKQRWGMRDILTAAALFDLVTILELQGKHTEPKALRLQIRHILDCLPAGLPLACAQGPRRESA